MRNCPNCNNVIPNRIIIEGKTYNLQRRKYCLECSPFKQHNTKQIHIQKELSPYSAKNYKKMTSEQKKSFNKLSHMYTKRRRYLRKKKLVLENGGKCIKCNYDNNISNLCFHHRDPTKKSFEINGHSIASKPWDKIKEEANKCDLLCFHCHNDFHYTDGLDWKNWDL
jgi:hypothetical protein